MKVGSIQCECSLSPRPQTIGSEGILNSETAMYAPGVGLGAGKAKEIGKHSETYLSAAQHSVRADRLFDIFLILSVCFRRANDIPRREYNHPWLP